MAKVSSGNAICHFTVLQDVSHLHPLSTNSRIKKKRETRNRRNIPENFIPLRSKETRLTGLITEINKR